MTNPAGNLLRVETVGLDIAKQVFCVHAVDSDGAPVTTRNLQRKEVLAFFASLRPCRVGTEASGSSHHWGRELQSLGHDVRLLHAAYVKPYVKRQKNDAADAAAICEAVTRPSMRFVKIRSVASQSVLVQHKVREKMIKQRTQLLNALHGHLSEYGVIAPRGQAAALVLKVREGHTDIPASVRSALLPLVAQIDSFDRVIRDADAAIVSSANADELARRLMTIPGIGPLTASALASIIDEPEAFNGPRSLSAFLGLTPRERSSGGTVRFGRISKMGNRYLRKLLVMGAFSVLRTRTLHDDPLRKWATKLLATKPYKVAAVAVANKLARIALAVMHSDQTYLGDGLSANR